MVTLNKKEVETNSYSILEDIVKDDGFNKAVDDSIKPNNKDTLEAVELESTPREGSLEIPEENAQPRYTKKRTKD